MSEGMHGFKDEQLSVLATWNLIEQFSPEPIPEPTGRKRRSRRNGRRRQGEDWRAQLELPSSALGETPDDAAEDADLPVRFHRYQGAEARRGKGRTGVQAPLPDYQVLDLRPGMMLPWQEIADAEAVEGEWRHTVYLGCFTAENIARELESIFVDSTDNLAVVRGMSACATVQLDSLGRVLPETAVLSSAAWGVGRARDPGPIVPWWFLGFDAGSKELVNSIRTFEARRSSDGHPCPQTSDSLAELVAIAQSAAGVTRIPSLARPAVRIKSVRVREPGAPGAHGLPPDVGEEDSLNSPFLDETTPERRSRASFRPTGRSTPPAGTTCASAARLSTPGSAPPAFPPADGPPTLPCTSRATSSSQSIAPCTSSPTGAGSSRSTARRARARPPSSARFWPETSSNARAGCHVCAIRGTHSPERFTRGTTAPPAARFPSSSPSSQVSRPSSCQPGRPTPSPKSSSRPPSWRKNGVRATRSSKASPPTSTAAAPLRPPGPRDAPPQRAPARRPPRRLRPGPATRRSPACR